MKNRIFTACMLALLLFPFPSKGGEEYPTVKAGVSSESATVGALIVYTVSITGKGVREMEILKPADTAFVQEKGKKQEAGKEKKDDPSAQVPLYIIHEASGLRRVWNTGIGRERLERRGHASHRVGSR